MSQLTLANMVDLTHNFINDIENGRKWISSETLARLSTALEVAPYQFFAPISASVGVEAEVMTTYLDNMEDSFIKMVRELRVRYLPDEDTKNM